MIYGSHSLIDTSSTFCLLARFAFQSQASDRQVPSRTRYSFPHTPHILFMSWVVTTLSSWRSGRTRCFRFRLTSEWNTTMEVGCASRILISFVNAELTMCYRAFCPFQSQLEGILPGLLNQSRNRRSLSESWIRSFAAPLRGGDTTDSCTLIAIDSIYLEYRTCSKKVSGV